VAVAGWQLAVAVAGWQLAVEKWLSNGPKMREIGLLLAEIHIVRNEFAKKWLWQWQWLGGCGCGWVAVAVGEWLSNGPKMSGNGLLLAELHMSLPKSGCGSGWVAVVDTMDVDQLCVVFYICWDWFSPLFVWCCC
jgi:hypothetical protein